MTDLLPCPFCGGEANTVLKGSDDWHIECHDCASRSGIYGIRESAIAAWNTRAERTCHAETDTDWYEGKLDGFKCGGCGWSGYVDDGMSAPTNPNYCPNCGSRVLEE